MEADTEAGEPKNPDKVFFEAAGGWRKGKVPGLGGASCMFYEKPSSRCGNSSSKYAPSEIVTLRETVDEYKREVLETRAELEEHRKLTAKMSKQFQQMSQLVRENCGSSFTPSQPDPEVDGGGDSV